jgi:hypothetical protein
MIGAAHQIRSHAAGLANNGINPGSAILKDSILRRRPGLTTSRQLQRNQ